jgi:hypothetical protein
VALFPCQDLSSLTGTRGGSGGGVEGAHPRLLKISFTIVIFFFFFALIMPSLNHDYALYLSYLNYIMPFNKFKFEKNLKTSLPYLQLQKNQERR